MNAPLQTTPTPTTAAETHGGSSNDEGRPASNAEVAAPEPHVEGALLDAVELGRDTEHVTLRSGRRYALEAGAHADRLTVRSASGRVLLRVAVTDDGPLLSFESADITLSARRRLALCAPEVAVAAGAISVRSGSLDQHIDGHRHTHVGGDDRLEAGAIEMQASAGSVGVRAAEHITLDGTHIGLNDDPCPMPFAWSDLADEGAELVDRHPADVPHAEGEPHP